MLRLGIFKEVEEKMLTMEHNRQVSGESLDYVLLFALPVLAACSGATVSKTTTRDARDGKADTHVSPEKYINNSDDYGATMRCVDGNHEPITSGLECIIRDGEAMQVKVFTDNTIGLPKVQ